MFPLQRTLRRAKGLVGRRRTMDKGPEAGPKERKLCPVDVTSNRILKIAIAGYHDVGKSCFIRKCAGVTVGTDYNSTKALERFGMHLVSGGGGSVQVLFVDMAVGDDAQPDRVEAFREADAVFLLFDLCNLGSLMSIKTTVYPEILRARGLPHRGDLDLPCMLVGNKLDQSRVNQGGLSLREVSEAQAGEVAAALSCPYREVSARTGEGVQECFREFLVTAIDCGSRKADRKKGKCGVQ